MSQDKVGLVRAAWEAWERGDMEAIFAFYDPAIVWDTTRYGDTIFSGVYDGHNGIKQFFREWLAPFESYYAHAEEFIDAGQAVVVRVRQGGRGKQSGAVVEITYWQVYRIRDGRAVRIELYRSNAEALEAVGLPQ